MIPFLNDVKGIEALLSGGKRLVLYHLDADGVTSAALFLKQFPSDSLALDSPHLDEAILEDIEKKAPDVLVFLDLSLDSQENQLKKLEAKKLIIDHHLFGNDLNSADTIFINPRLIRRDAYLSTSYIVYHLLKGMKKSPDSWVAGIGVIGDYAFEEGKDVLEEVRKGKPYLVEGKPRESRLGEASGLISSAITAHGERGGEEALKTLINAKDFEEFEGNGKLQEWKSFVEEEVERVVNSFEGERDFFPEKKLAILEVKSHLSISSTVSTILAERNPDLTIIIMHEDEEGVKLSLRNQSGSVDLNDIVRKAVEGIGRGGGHEKAAGALVTNWEMFKKRLLSELS